MALNFPGPYQLRVFYSVQSRPHVLQLNLDLVTAPAPGDPFSAIATVSPNGVNPTLQLVTDNLVTAFKAFLNSGDGSISHAELWSFTPLTFDAQFVTSYSIAVAGTSASPTQNAGQMIITFRTVEGGIMRFDLLDGAQPPGQPVLPASFNTNMNTLVSALMGPGVPFLGRDTSRPFVVLRLFPGQNEALFKKIYRQ